MMKIHWMDSYLVIMDFKSVLLMDETYNKKGWQVKHPSLPILFIAGADDPCIGSKKQYAQAMTTLKSEGIIRYVECYF